MYMRKKKEPVRVPFEPEAINASAWNRYSQKKICSDTSRRLIWNMTKKTERSDRSDLPSGPVPHG